MIRYCMVACLFLVSCVNTQPVIDSVMEWKRIEDAELAKHRQLASVAKFSENPEEQSQMMDAYLTLLNQHQAASDQFATALADWARKVGQYDPAYADKKVDEMLDIYIRIKEALEDE